MSALGPHDLRPASDSPGRHTAPRTRAACHGRGRALGPLAARGKHSPDHPLNVTTKAAGSGHLLAASGVTDASKAERAAWGQLEIATEGEQT